MDKVIVTGGSGFIGTNLIEHLLRLNFQVLNLDILPPVNSNLGGEFQAIDLKNFSALSKCINEYNPDYIIHLAARTDLDGKNLDDYQDNILAVENLCKSIIINNNISKVIFSSSMLVCRAGYCPKDNFDYCPTTVYGKSKVETEKIITNYSSQLPSYQIIRPTSIWGPWFKTPYKDFFDMVLNKKFVRLGSRCSTKTYGYVGNTTGQIISLVTHSKVDKGSVYYLGDEPALNVNDWAISICTIAKIPAPKSVPYSILKVGALFGDLLKYLGFTFPLTSFRLKNLTTDNVYNDLPIIKINKYKVISLKGGLQRTLSWMGY